MAERRAKFVAIPNISPTGLDQIQYVTLNALKENVEQLIGARDASSVEGNKALLAGQIGFAQIPSIQSFRITAQGVGFTIEQRNVASLDDHVKLMQDVQLLINDVRGLKSTLDLLIKQLTG